MKAQAHTKHIAELIKSAKQQFGDFSEDKKQQIFLTIKEAKVRELLRKQPYDRCLSEYINTANHLLRSYATDEFTAALNQNLDYIYICVRCARQHQFHQRYRLTRAASTQRPKLPPLKRGSRGMSRKTSGALMLKLA
jgi:hypothetical protein